MLKDVHTFAICIAVDLYIHLDIYLQKKKVSCNLAIHYY